jgi:hypothetical protein
VTDLRGAISPADTFKGTVNFATPLTIPIKAILRVIGFVVGFDISKLLTPRTLFHVSSHKAAYAAAAIKLSIIGVSSTLVAVNGMMTIPAIPMNSKSQNSIAKTMLIFWPAASWDDPQMLDSCH